MTVYMHDGVEFDLDGDFADVLGVVWSWTGEWSPAAEPMLRSDVPSLMALPLPDVYHHQGPLIPIRRKTVPWAKGFAESLAAGFVETDEAFAARIGGRP